MACALTLDNPVKFRFPWRSELPEIQHHQRAGLDAFDSSLSGLGDQFGVFGAGIENDSTWTEAENEVQKRSLPDRTHVHGDSMDGRQIHGIQVGVDGDSRHRCRTQPKSKNGYPSISEHVQGRERGPVRIVGGPQYKCVFFSHTQDWIHPAKIHHGSQH